MTTVYDQLVAAGCEIDSHESDLYVKATPAAAAILDTSDLSYGTFRDSQNVLWYEVPFAFMPFWRKKGGSDA